MSGGGRGKTWVVGAGVKLARFHLPTTRRFFSVYLSHARAHDKGKTWVVGAGRGKT